MKKKLSMGKILIMQRGASLVAVFAMLVISVAAAISLSFGWFAKNNQVTASGMHTQAYRATFSASYQIETYDAQGIASYVDAEIDDLYKGLVAPGDSVKIRVTITNTGKYAVNLTQFVFEAPTQRDDVPKYDEEGKPRYLSTELYAQILSVSGTSFKADQFKIEYPKDSSEGLPEGAVPDTVHFLREGDSWNPGLASRIDFMADVGESVAVELDSGESVIFEISVTFAKTNHNQNIYKGFADHGGKCVRRFFLTYDN